MAIVIVAILFIVGFFFYLAYTRGKFFSDWVVVIGPALVVALAVAVVDVDVTFSGGVPWADKDAQSFMVQLLDKEYSESAFTVVTKAYWQPHRKSYEIGVVFQFDRSTEYNYILLPLKGYQMLWFEAPSTAKLVVISEEPAPGVDAQTWYQEHPVPSFQPEQGKHSF